MDDSRLQSVRTALVSYKSGQFDVELPGGSNDEVGLLVRDVQALGDAFKFKVHKLHHFANITAKVNQGLRLEEVLNEAYGSLQQIVPFDRLGFALLDHSRKRVIACWARSNREDVHLQVGYSAPLEGSSLQTILETGKPRIINDLHQYLRDHPQSESTQLIVEEGMRSSLTCPLVSLGDPVGFLFFSSRTPETYRDAHVEDFQEIAAQISIIVEKSRLYEELLQTLQLKDRFLGIAAHDLRHPLAVIQKYAEVLLGGLVGALSPEQQHIVSRMETVSKHMLDLINKLLDISAIQAGKLSLTTRKVDPKGVIIEQASLYQILGQGKQIELITRLDPELPPITCDPERVGQIISNLLANAIKFSPSGTSVVLHATSNPNEFVVSVSDQGPGIPSEELSKLFKEFSRTSVQATAGEKGSGLGLAICQRIAEAHGGKIEVQSEVGRGSTFTLRLPLSTVALGA